MERGRRAGASGREVQSKLIGYLKVIKNKGLIIFQNNISVNFGIGEGFYFVPYRRGIRVSIKRTNKLNPGAFPGRT